GLLRWIRLPADAPGVARRVEIVNVPQLVALQDQALAAGDLLVDPHAVVGPRGGRAEVDRGGYDILLLVLPVATVWPTSLIRARGVVVPARRQDSATQFAHVTLSDRIKERHGCRIRRGAQDVVDVEPGLRRLAGRLPRRGGRGGRVVVDGACGFE